MHVITYKRIKEFVANHPESNVALGNWYKKMKRSNFDNVNEIRRSFKDSDYIGNQRFVFNICNNKFRLVTVILISTQIVLIRFIGTHEEYVRINSKII